MEKVRSVSKVVPAASGSKPGKKNTYGRHEILLRPTAGSISRVTSFGPGTKSNVLPARTALIVPHIHPPPSAAAPAPNRRLLRPQHPAPPQARRPGSAQVTRPARTVSIVAPGNAWLRPPKTQNPLVKYAVIAVVLAVIGGAWVSLFAWVADPGSRDGHFQNGSTHHLPRLAEEPGPWVK